VTLSPWWFILLGGLVTYAWRGVGVGLSGRMAAEGPFLRWVTAVAYALLAGLIARMIVLPQGTLTDTPLLVRLSAALAALLVYAITRRNLLLGVTAGTVWFVIFTWV
jgi:branched-subunit amino acid transport protein